MTALTGILMIFAFGAMMAALGSKGEVQVYGLKFERRGDRELFWALTTLFSIAAAGIIYFLMMLLRN